ncbi:proton/sodium-glutamate symport protein [Plesiocystis pacifica SIR-1]|uniref:Proton/sodium-glutamate symport protein n=1 Tax=Plesiocystis pacifica SIR-1 TaxID=391625 RepID=A6GEH9_9BACT|nr:dicarboxylate/amino acid:cation symporter [Plesiocystis pacifica]EDM75751.1 proton/sodium-glutamate symport protein [Plesiocystis pacifica SIR-1]
MTEDGPKDGPTPEPPDAETSGGMQLYTKILIGMVVGSVLAVLCKELLTGTDAWVSVFADQAALQTFGERWIEPVGKLFIRSIILTVVPLVFTSIATGMHSLGDPRDLGRLGGRTVLVFMTTAFLGAVLATLLYLAIQPGSVISPETRDLLAAQFAEQATTKTATAGQAQSYFSGSILQILVGLIPENIVLSMTSNRDLLKVILFALAFGISLTLIDKERARPVVAVLDGVNEAMIKLIELLMKLAPYGVAALVFMVVARFGLDVLQALALYTAVVLIALAAHLLLVLAPLIRLLAGMRPIEFIRAIREVWITAFSTSSSAATLPTTIRVTQEKLDVPKPIAGFVLPLGATINMDGTTIYQVIAVHFVAQVWGIQLEPSAYLTLILVSMLMAIGAAGVPGGVIPLLYVVMVTVGIPEPIVAMGIALILGMDRILDMCRSAVNVVGDSTTAVIIARLEARRATPS